MQPNYLFQLKSQILKLKNPVKAKVLQHFFKTGKGEYGEGDIFFGIIVPLQRKLAKKFWRQLTLKDISTLLKSPIHEHRLIALLILVEKYNSVTNLVPENKHQLKTIFNFYLKHTRYINNWDLVDLSAHKIVGAFLYNKDKTILKKLAKSKNLWERRIAIISTFYDIYQGKYEWTFKISDLLIKDSHDLIHKASGWMLREAGKRCDEKALTNYLNKRFKTMPRTMLRYAIERLPNNLKSFYMSK